MEIPAFYPIIDTQVLAQTGLTPVEMASALARVQVSLVQFRHKGVYTREVLALAEEVGKIVKQSGARYIINDRADIALLLAADGIHVGQDDLPPAEVRKLAGKQMILGYSTHNEQQLREGDREPVDYLALGPIFGTPSKQNPDPVVGAAELARLRAFTTKPLVAIGGIARANAREVLAAGANSLAVISDAVGPDLDARLAEWISLTRG
jgi:thiamine-phosphate pyrophosphorylase